MAKTTVSTGIELDSQSIRAARITGRAGRTGLPVISALDEVKGPFTKDEEVVEGLRTLKRRMGISSSDRVAVCVGGKQVYAAQLNFRKLPDEEMKNALRLELRKNLPFDTASATIEYQFMAQVRKKGDSVPVLVTAVANAMLDRNLWLFEKAGMPPAIVDVFPLTVANAALLGKNGRDTSETPRNLIHVGAEFSTFVIDGPAGIPFFTRTLYFSAAELYGPDSSSGTAPQNPEQKVAAFTDEISRSLTYYQNTFRCRTDTLITALGGHAVPSLLERIADNTGCTVTRLDLAGELDAADAPSAGKFDIAITLGMRGMDR